MKRNTRLIVYGLIGVLLIGALSVGSVYAYLKLMSGTATNTLSPAVPVDPTINESFDGKTKTNVSVSVGDTGYSVYLRCAILANWVSTTDPTDVNAIAPIAGVDYQINLNTVDWILGPDRFYYHKSALNSGETGEVLIYTCSPIEAKVPSGYRLEVKVHAQTIQALGSTDADGTPAVQSAWKVVTADGLGGDLSLAP